MIQTLPIVSASTTVPPVCAGGVPVVQVCVTSGAVTVSELHAPPSEFGWPHAPPAPPLELLELLDAPESPASLPPELLDLLDDPPLEPLLEEPLPLPPPLEDEVASSDAAALVVPGEELELELHPSEPIPAAANTTPSKHPFLRIVEIFMVGSLHQPGARGHSKSRFPGSF